MAVYTLHKAKKNRVIKTIPLESTTVGANIPAVMTRFNMFWDLMDAIEVHGYVRAAMSVVGRSTVGAWWNLRKHDEFSSEATERQRKRLMLFYMMPYKPWNNIKDYQSFAYKIMIAAMYLRYFGRTAFQIVRNAEGKAIGFDFLHGYVIPNVDKEGNFKTPAFIQYITRNPSDKVEFTNPRDIIYIVNPDWEGYPDGGSDIESLTDFAIPLDLYLQVAAREYMKNRDKPEAFYLLPSDISDEAFNDFVTQLEARYAGPQNVGRNPIAVQGDLEIKELSRLPSDLPYQEARTDTRQEVLAVSGVAGAKLGLTESLSSANLREVRREFHETTMIPLFRLIELSFYEQIHIREFGIAGWEFKFNSPDFLNAVERATVHMRYRDMGVLTPNEIRHDLGKPERKDENGDKYSDQLGNQQPGASQGNPPEGREERPDAPGQTGEPTLDDQDPPRGDQHDDVTERGLFDELHRWRTFAINRAKRGKSIRPFECKFVPAYMQEVIQARLTTANDVQGIRGLFTEVETLLLEELVGE